MRQYEFVNANSNLEGPSSDGAAFRAVICIASRKNDFCSRPKNVVPVNFTIFWRVLCEVFANVNNFYRSVSSVLSNESKNILHIVCRNVGEVMSFTYLFSR